MERPQDFELITLLFEQTKILKYKVNPTEPVFNSFQPRFQSFIDQIPAYLHSNKPGFFTHFFLGSFSTLLNTELNQKINIDEIYFRFYRAETLKVFAKAKNNKMYVFIFTEIFTENNNKVKYTPQQINDKFEFTAGELSSIGYKYTAIDKNDINIKLIKINKIKIKKETTIIVDVTDKNVKIDDAYPTSKFEKIGYQKNQSDYLEKYIRELSDPNTEQVEIAFRKILSYISNTHKTLNLPINVYGSEAREADQHGFVAGVLDNFHYRHNTRIYLEPFASRGYADIVLLVRGTKRSVKSIPIVIELKADNPKKQDKTLPSDAFNQAMDKYIPGFQPNTVRVLTLSDNILCVGLNIDYVPTNFIKDVLNDVNGVIGNNNVDVVLDNNTRANLIKNVTDELSKFVVTNDSHLTKIIERWKGTKSDLKKQIKEFMELNFKSEIVKRETQDIRPIIGGILQATQEFSANPEELREKVSYYLERAYNTFPGTKESRSNHYFSRFLLGQSILLSDDEYEKHVFHYKKEHIIPTEKLPERITKQPPRATKTENIEKSEEKAKKELDTSHAVTTVYFIPSNEDPVILLNIVEGNRNIINKKINLDDNLVSNRSIIKLDIYFRTDKINEKFSQYFSNLSVEKYATLAEYNLSNPDTINNENENNVYEGEFKRILYPENFKVSFDTALNSQKDEHFSNVRYLELFNKISKGISNFRSLDTNFVSLITEEAHFQGVSHGAFSYYSDLKLAEPLETRALVLTEFQTGGGKRIDMLIHGIGPSLDFKEFKPVAFEFKGPRESKNANKLMEEAKKQLNNYKSVTYKTLTDGDTVQLIPVIFDDVTTDENHIIQSDDALFTVPVIHSSIAVITQGVSAYGIDSEPSTSGAARSSRPVLYSPADDSMPVQGSRK